MADYTVHDYDVTQLAQKRGRTGKYPWNALAVGQSFVIPYTNGVPMLAGIQAYCYRKSKETGNTYRAYMGADGTTIVVGRTA
jgi:hypothetical protein